MYVQTHVSAEIAEKISLLGAADQRSRADMATLLLSWLLDDEEWLLQAVTSKWYSVIHDAIQLPRVAAFDALGNVTTYDYDTSNSEVTIILPDPDGAGPQSSPQIVSAYDYRGLLLTQTDPLGGVTAYEYDGARRRVLITAPDPDGGGPLSSPVTENEYDAVGNLRFVTDPLGNVTERVYDKANRLIELIEADPDGVGGQSSPEWVYAYSAAGFLASLTDPLSRVTSYVYDALGRQTKVTLPDPDGVGGQTAPESTSVYDAAGRLVSQTNALGYITTYAYDLLDNLIAVTEPDPDGGGGLTSPVTSYEYDLAGQLLEMTDALGRVTTYEYDALGRRTVVTLPDPDGIGGVSASETTYVYDAMGNLLETIDPLGNRQVSAYDNLYRVIATRQANGALPSTSAATSVQGAGSNEFQRVGFTVTSGDIYGGTFTLSFNGQTTSSIAWNASAATVEAALEALSNVGDGDVAVTKVSDSATAQLWEIEFQGALAGANVAQTTINSSSIYYATLAETESTLVNGHSTNEVQSVTIADATGGTFQLDFGTERTTALDFDATAGEVESALEALTAIDNVSVSGSAGGPWTITFQGGLAGQDVPSLVVVSQLTNANLLTETSYAYDAAGRLLSLTDPVGNTTEWEYDFLGRKIEETNELNKTRTFAYDAVGNLIGKVDRLGRETVWEYDNLYRNTAEKWYDGMSLVRTLSLSYSAVGDLVAVSDPDASYAYSYDALGRVISQGQTITGLTPSLNYASEYDALSRRTELLASIGGDEDFLNTYTYDNLSRLTRVQQGSGTDNVVAEKRFDFDYNAASQYSQITRYADLAGTEFVANTFYVYDGIGRLTKLLHTDDGSLPGSGWGTDPLAGYDYAYDAANRIASIDSLLDGLTEYGHDDTNQLVEADHTSIADENYEYDENGNRIMSGYSTGDNNQLLADGTYNYTYDDEGNRLTRTKISDGYVTRYQWDHRNRLIGVIEEDDEENVLATVEHSYDAFNRWVRRVVDADGPGGDPAAETFFSWEADQINLEFAGDDAADLSQRHLWNPAAIDQILAVEEVDSLLSVGDVIWPLTDHLGTPRDLASYDSGTNETTLENHRIFDSFGNLVSQTNGSFTIAVGFTGVFFDAATGLNYHRNRWYDMRIGRWTREDPIGFSAGDTNLLRMVGNGVLSATDPMGTEGINVNYQVGSRRTIGWDSAYAKIDFEMSFTCKCEAGQWNAYEKTTPYRNTAWKESWVDRVSSGPPSIRRVTSLLPNDSLRVEWSAEVREDAGAWGIGTAIGAPIGMGTGILVGTTVGIPTGPGAPITGTAGGIAGAGAGGGAGGVVGSGVGYFFDAEFWVTFTGAWTVTCGEVQGLDNYRRPVVTGDTSFESGGWTPILVTLSWDQGITAN